MSSPPQPFYGAPYRDNDAYYHDGTSPTIAQQVANDWLHYQIAWGVAPYKNVFGRSLICSYVFTPLPNGATTDRFGTLVWTGQCGGGDIIEGTLQCPAGWTLQSGQCFAPPELALKARAPFIPYMSGVQDGRVLTESKLTINLTQGGQPVGGGGDLLAIEPRFGRQPLASRTYDRLVGRSTRRGVHA